jgi:hypothetical protein
MTYQQRRNFRRTRMSVRNHFARCLQHADFAVDDAPVPKPFYPKHGLRPLVLALKRHGPAKGGVVHAAEGLELVNEPHWPS